MGERELSWRWPAAKVAVVVVVVVSAQSMMAAITIIVITQASWLVPLTCFKVQFVLLLIGWLAGRAQLNPAGLTKQEPNWNKHLLK